MRQKKHLYINKDSGNTSLEFFPPKIKGRDRKYLPTTPQSTRLERSYLNLRSYQVGVVLIILLVGILIKTGYLQVVKGAQYQELYASIHSKTEWILAPRGLITDRGGEVLAYNAPSQKANEFSRFYPYREAFAHVLGYVGKISKDELQSNQSYLPFDVIGKTGIEQAYEKELHGTNGRIDNLIAATGQSLEKTSIIKPTVGNTVVLTLDAQIQQKLAQALSNSVAASGGSGGAAVMLNPKNGDVLGLVSVPSFDNNALSEEILIDKNRPLFNRAIAGEYPPGSAIKPFIASAALQEEVISPFQKILDTGRIVIQSIFDPNISWTFRSWKALGPVDVRSALALSSNVYFYTVGGGYQSFQGLGISKIGEYLKRFGFSESPLIDIAGAGEGFIPSPEWKENTLGNSWFIGDTYNTAIGQGFVRVTPLQLAVATAAIANGGTLHTPRLLERIEEPNGNTIKETEPEIAGILGIKESNITIVKEGMRLAVKEGTVKRLNAIPLAIAAKTGSAQSGSSTEAHGWVTLFAPYENPEFVLTILVEHGGGGEQAAVPVAQEFLEWYATREVNTGVPN